MAEHPTACRKQAVTPGIIDVILTTFYFFLSAHLKDFQLPIELSVNRPDS